MLSLDLWYLTPTSADPAQQDVSRQQLTFKDALQWLRGATPTSRQTIDWRVEILTAHVDGIAKYIVPLTRLVSALGFEPEDASTVADTVVFNSYIADDQNADSVSHGRRFCLSDNMFGIYWHWDPTNRCTKALMYGMAGEGTRQMQQVWKRVSSAPDSCLSHPLLVGVAALEAEVTEMKRWVASQSDELVRLHIDTGHHGYATTEHRELDTSKLAKMSRDVCGFAINISTSVLCLQRILKFADFLVDECEDLGVMLQQSPVDPNATLRNELHKSHLTVRSRAQVWRRRADALLDEAETWKSKADVLVQTVFTLTTQRDTGISIQIAQDSRTLAQQATRDSTSMKAIAAVTMCFLPGTFVAVRSPASPERESLS